MLDIWSTVVDFVCLFCLVGGAGGGGICTPPEAVENNTLCKNECAFADHSLLFISLCTSESSCSKANECQPGVKF